MNILLLEDDFDYQQSIQEYLTLLEYQVDTFSNGDDAFNAIYEQHYHLLILDIRVPGMSGYEIVKQLREDNNPVPIIFITSLTDINNLSLGYELGCNDYIKKPFSPKELKYRVEQLIKAFYFQSQNNISLTKHYHFDTKNKQLFKQNQQIHLTKKESEVVFTLISKKDCYVSCEELRQEVWNDKFINEADIRVCIKNIRQKSDKELIENRRGIGYKIARV